MISKQTTWTNVKAMLQSRALNAQWVQVDSIYMIAAIDGQFALECSIFVDPDTPSVDQIDFETNFKVTGNKKIGPIEVFKVPDPAPFATPTYRTKRNATPNLVGIAPGTSAPVDFIMPEERYVQGGKILVTNPQPGDYFTAEVNDPSGLIPPAYRALMCEAWPTVARYIDKEWMEFSGIHEINTYPLNAKITPGLALRVTYFASPAGAPRSVGINYYLTKKL